MSNPVVGHSVWGDAGGDVHFVVVFYANGSVMRSKLCPAYRGPNDLRLGPDYMREVRGEPWPWLDCLGWWGEVPDAWRDKPAS